LASIRGCRSAGLARASEDTQIVITTVERPNNPPTRIDWVIATNTGGPKIVDLLAEGSSLRLTQTADFTAYLARHQYNYNTHELIEGMRQRIAPSE
jgi:phospholipid transport system substrate-binding protein